MCIVEVEKDLISNNQFNFKELFYYSTLKVDVVVESLSGFTVILTFIYQPVMPGKRCKV